MTEANPIPEAPTDWTGHLVDQLSTHWTLHLRPKLEGLTDDEYLWEPVDGCWSLRQRGKERTELALGSGDTVMEVAYPEPDDPPFTTIAWRLAHISVWVLGLRNMNHFGGPETGFSIANYAPSAAAALAQLDEAVAHWLAGVAELSPDRLHEPVGEAEGPFAEHPYASLVLHVNREVIHHGAEVLVLRDLHAHRQGDADGR
jgi:hypothetical protein